MSIDNVKVYSKQGSIVIESDIVKIREIIQYDSIEGITIRNVNETYSNELEFFLNKPIYYENLGKHFFHEIIFQIFLFFHQKRLMVNIAYSDDVLYKILKEIKANLRNVNIPENLEKSTNWKTIDKSHNFSRIKLIYSKNNLGLYDILKKHSKIK